MFQMLAEVVGAEELLSLITLAEPMNLNHVFGALLPLRRIFSEFFTTVTAGVCTAGMCYGKMETGSWTIEGSARPRVAPQMERVLVAFDFVLGSEVIRTVSTDVLLFGLVTPEIS